MVAPRRPLITTTPKEALATHDSLSRLAIKVSPLSNTRSRGIVAFDLTKVPDIDPGGLILIWYSAYNLNDLGWRLDVFGDSSAMRKLERNLMHMTLSPAGRRAFVCDKGEYPMRAVADKDKMVEEIELWSKSVREGTGIQEETAARWEQQISEVLTNGFQHGQTTKPILLAGGVDEQNRRVSLAALDLGLGIPRVIEPHVDEKLRGGGDGGLIFEACKEGITSRCSRQNQGYGLPHLIDSVRDNGGTLQIFSQRGFVHVDNEGITPKNFEKSERRLKGTLTLITLRF